MTETSGPDSPSLRYCIATTHPFPGPLALDPADGQASDDEAPSMLSQRVRQQPPDCPGIVGSELRGHKGGGQEALGGGGPSKRETPSGEEGEGADAGAGDAER